MATMGPIEVRVAPTARPGPTDEALRRRGPLPGRASAGAAGFDVVAWIERAVTLAPGQRAKIGCGFAIELPVGYEAQMRPRSGLALEYGVTLLNAPGTVDADYRGEVCAIVYNAGEKPFVVEPGMRIAQLVVAAVAPVTLVQVRELSRSDRGSGGFGSTGTS
ncbi:MAG: dUTP diphosphatase [Deltaproteobacteria bacterium]|nr:dUTP diphosphatase [Deltaproteobacteria bacterium]